MTNASITKKDKTYELRLDGHAGDSDVCVAISTIAYTIAFLLGKTDRDGLTDTEEVTLEPGNTVIRFVSRTSLSGKLISETMASGLGMLAENYPECINLNLAL